MKQKIKKIIESRLDSYPKVFFCHVPKCGGVSFSDAIYEALYPKILKASRFAEFFKVVVRFSRFMLLPELARFPAQDSDLLAL